MPYAMLQKCYNLTMHIIIIIFIIIIIIIITIIIFIIIIIIIIVMEGIDWWHFAWTDF